MRRRSWSVNVRRDEPPEDVVCCGEGVVSGGSECAVANVDTGASGGGAGIGGAGGGCDDGFVSMLGHCAATIEGGACGECEYIGTGPRE